MAGHHHRHPTAHRHDAPSGAGVVLDIGGDIGALLVHLGDQAVDDEIDIQPVGYPAGRFHTGVHERDVDGAPTPVALFPEVASGRYELLDRHGAPFATVDAVGGEVVTLDLR